MNINNLKTLISEIQSKLNEINGKLDDADEKYIRVNSIKIIDAYRIVCK